MGGRRPTGIFKKKLDYFRGVRDGKIKDPKSLGVIYEYPDSMIEEKAYLDPENFYVTNPNLGISVDRQWLVEELEKAKIGGPESMVGFAAKHLNIEITQGLRSDGWSGAKHWADGAEKGLTLAEVIRRSEVLTVGSDGDRRPFWGLCPWSRTRNRGLARLGSCFYFAARLGAPQG
jgi:phage terminase large subunit-like protein